MIQVINFQSKLLQRLSLQVPSTKDLTDDELLKVLESDDMTHFRIPMCIGEAHAEVDKSKKLGQQNI